MTAVDRLKRDHKVLRAKLSVLEAALNLPGDTWFVLREICFTLSRQLRNHIHREEELVAACRAAMNPHVLAEVAVEHHDEPQLLRTINRLFVSEEGHAMEHIRPSLEKAIGGLRRHMDEEERELFPILDRTLAEAVGTSAQPAGTLQETMTINRIVHEFPATRPVLEGLFVNIPAEGCQCLDEVAWRHGMESEELLKTLEETIAACRCRHGDGHDETAAQLSRAREL